MDGDVFLAPFEGQLVECHSVEDAVAIKTAGQLLRTGDSVTASELHRLANALSRYGFEQHAEKLRNQLNRLRAAQFLSRFVGYERPATPYNPDSAGLTRS
jgi:hypothetical protein